MVWYSYLFENFPQFLVIHTVKGFGIVNKAEVDVFRELSCFFHDPADAGNLISGSSAFSKTSLNIWKFTVHVLLKPGLENEMTAQFFLSYLDPPRVRETIELTGDKSASHGFWGCTLTSSFSSLYLLLFFSNDTPLLKLILIFIIILYSF